MSFFKPDRFFTRISSINIEQDIVSQGYECVLLDVDNTILTRDTHQVPEDVRLWLKVAEESGIKVCLLSNNMHESVLILAQTMGLSIVSKAMKPLPFGYHKALKLMRVSKAKTLMIGDQLVTDVFGAHAAGMRAYMVLPLVKQDLKHTLAFRKLEKIFMADMKPEL